MSMTRLCGLAAILLLLAPAVARAQAASCTVGSTSMNFGGYDGSQATPSVSTAIVSVTCLPLDQATTVNFTIALLGGTGGQGARQLSSGTERLNMEIYTDANRSIVFGDGTGGTALLSGSGIANTATPLRMNFTVYGRVPARQRTLKAGSYMDVLTVLMAY